MGEQTILVCDVCGRPAVDTATIRVGGRNFVKDYCAAHLAELTAGGRAPRRGRRKSISGGSAAPRRRGRPPKSASAKRTTARKRTTAKKSTGKRRGRPRKAQASS